MAAGTIGTRAVRTAKPRPCSNSQACTPDAASRPKADPPDSGTYAGLSIFAAPGNTRTMRFQSDNDVTLPGALYGPSTRVRMERTGDLQVDSLMVVRALSMTTVPGSDASVTVNYSPSVLLPGVGPPVPVR